MSIGAPPADERGAGGALGYWAWRATDISPGGAAAVTASRAVMAGGDVNILGGWSIKETTGAAGAAYRLWNGRTTGGELLATVTLAANESNREIMGGAGIRVPSGRIYLEVLSGSIEGVIYWR